jgi:hypothetical protein
MINFYKSYYKSVFIKVKFEKLKICNHKGNKTFKVINWIVGLKLIKYCQ